MMEFQGKELIAGTIEGQTLTLGAPLSLWDGIDSRKGIIATAGHPNEGECIAGKILVISKGLAGATGGGSLTECFRRENGPIAMVMPKSDPMVVAAAVFAEELYDKHIPILQIDSEKIVQIPNDAHVRISNGTLTVNSK